MAQLESFSNRSAAAATGNGLVFKETSSNKSHPPVKVVLWSNRPTDNDQGETGNIAKEVVVGDRLYRGDLHLTPYWQREVERLCGIKCYQKALSLLQTPTQLLTFADPEVDAYLESIGYC